MLAAWNGCCSLVASRSGWGQAVFIGAPRGAESSAAAVRAAQAI
jgi:hypothetical protein